MIHHCFSLIKRRIPLLLIASLIIPLAACGHFLKPYKISIQQGNIVTYEMVAKLDKGMTKKQVEYVLGTPLIHDTFEPDAWHYLYSLRLGTGETLQSRLTINFVDGQLAIIDTNVEESEIPDPNQLIIQDEDKKFDRSPAEDRIN